MEQPTLLLTTKAVLYANYQSKAPGTAFMDGIEAVEGKPLSEDWSMRPYEHMGRFGQQIVCVD